MAAALTDQQQTELETLMASGFKVSDALERIVTLSALNSIVADRDRVLREFLECEAERVKAESGAPANWPIKGIGRAQTVIPADVLVVTDEQAWSAFLLARYPERTQTRRTVNAARLLEMADSDPELAERLEAAHVIEVQALPEEGLAAEVLEGARRTDAGLVDPVTGEVLPAVARPGGRAYLRVTVDKKAVERTKADLLANGMPEIRPQIGA